MRTKIRRPSDKKQYGIKSNCKECGKEVFSQASELRRARHTGLCRSCSSRRHHSGRIPTEDKIVIGGSVIHWALASYICNLTPSTPGPQLSVPVTCGYCGKTRPVSVSAIMNKQRKARNHSYFGFHKECYSKGRDSIRQVINSDPSTRSKKFKGFIETQHGYINLNINYLPTEQQPIARKMQRESDGYISEHRLVMAIHIGRPLESDEIVHHLDGKKSNNSISNLRLLKVDKHHSGHGDDYYQKYQECLSSIKILLSILSVIKLSAPLV